MAAVAGFVIASDAVRHGAVAAEIVAFRLLQGLFGAALVPLSQAILLDIYHAGGARLGDGAVRGRR